MISFIANQFVVTRPQDFEAGDKSVKELGLIHTDYPSILAEDSCLDALHVLYTKKVHALAITAPMPSGASEV